MPRDQAQPESQSGDAPFARGVVAVIRAPAAAIALTVARGLAGTDVAGIEVTMTLDEQAFAGSSLRIFAEVMDRFLAVYASTNNFVQLVILSANTGVELRRCAPRQGVQTIL